MQVRRIVPIAAVAVVAAGAYLPANAAPKAFTGSYTVTLTPDPVINAYSTAGKKNCYTLSPSSVDRRNIKFPRAGRLSVVLESAQDTPPVRLGPLHL